MELLNYALCIMNYALIKCIDKKKSVQTPHWECTDYLFLTCLIY